MQRDGITVEGIRFPIQIHFEPRNNARASVGRRAIYIRIPSSMNISERARIIVRFKGWARETIRKDPERFKPVRVHRYKDGDLLEIHSETFVIRIAGTGRKTASAAWSGTALKITVPSHLSRREADRETGRLLARALGERFQPELENLVNDINQRYFQVEPGKVAFRTTRAIWGSCTANGDIHISTRLLFAPLEVLRYVCVHELAHLKERNHSKRFWNTVKRACTDFRDQQLWLRGKQGFRPF